MQFNDLPYLVVIAPSYQKYNSKTKWFNFYYLTVVIFNNFYQTLYAVLLYKQISTEKYLWCIFFKHLEVNHKVKIIEKVVNILTIQHYSIMDRHDDTFFMGVFSYSYDLKHIKYIMDKS